MCPSIAVARLPLVDLAAEGSPALALALQCEDLGRPAGVELAHLEIRREPDVPRPDVAVRELAVDSARLQLRLGEVRPRRVVTGVDGDRSVARCP